MADEVQKLFFAYAERTAVGTARGLYRIFGDISKSVESLSLYLQTFEMGITHYCNKSYHSLLIGDDDVVLRDCLPFANHSPVCLFTLKHSFIIGLFKRLDLRSLDWTTLESFTASLVVKWREQSPLAEQKISAAFLHKCQGPRKENCNPDKPLFLVTEKEEVSEEKNVCCSVHGCTTTPMFQCSRCHQALYCSQSHQRIHWKQHKPFCKN